MKHLDDKIFRPFLHNIQGKCFVTTHKKRIFKFSSTRSSAQDPIYRSCVTDYEIAIKVVEGAQVSKSEKASSYSKNIKSQLLTNECVSTTLRRHSRYNCPQEETNTSVKKNKLF